jgi:hypothetical protein
MWFLFLKRQSLKVMCILLQNHRQLRLGRCGLVRKNKSKEAQQHHRFPCFTLFLDCLLVCSFSLSLCKSYNVCCKNVWPARATQIRSNSASWMHCGGGKVSGDYNPSLPTLLSSPTVAFILYENCAQLQFSPPGLRTCHQMHNPQQPQVCRTRTTLLRPRRRRHHREAAI